MSKGIRFADSMGVTTLDGSIKGWSYEKIEETFKGKLDYVALAKQLGIEPKKSNPKGNATPNADSDVKDK